MTAITTTSLGAALNAAIQGGYVAQLSGQTYTVTQPIVVYINSTTQGPMGIDLGGATIISNITDGSPVIKIVVGPGVDARYLTLMNFTLKGNGHEGDGIQLVADGNDRWLYNYNISNVNVDHVGGVGLDVIGSVFEGLVSNSWMTNDGQGGARFAHSANGGQVSALRWFGGGFENNGVAGMILTNGARDMSVDGTSFINNHGYGISAEYGITSVNSSTFQDNQGVGVWFQNYGNFNDDKFITSGSQTTGINAWLNGYATVINTTSTWTGTGPDPTVLANLQGYGGAFQSGDTGHITTGANVVSSGPGGGNLAHVSVGTQGVALPSLSAVNAATTAAVASSSGTSAVETALKAAVAGNTVVHLTDASTYTVTAPIVINLTGSTNGPIGIDLGGAKIMSQISNGGPVIEIIVGAGVDISQLTLSNFTLDGNGREGDGIKIIADGTNRTIHNLNITNVNIEHVGGIGLDVVGNVSQGVIYNSWMHGDNGGGARFADSAGGGVASGLQWLGGGFRKNGVAGLILDNGAHDMTVKGAYFVENNGPGIDATSGITLVKESGFENNQGTAALVQGPSSFVDNSFSTHGPQTVGVGGYLAGGQVNMIGNGAEYYGAGSDPSVITNLQGNGTLAMAGGGNVIVGPNVAVTGGVAGTPTPTPTSTPTSTPVVTEKLFSDTGLSASDGVTSSAALTGTADANSVVHFTVDGSAIAATATANASGAWSFTPTGLADGTHTIVASETNAGGTGTASLSFTLDTTAPTVTEKLVSGGTTTSNPALTGTADPNAVVHFTVDGSAIAATATANASGAWSFTPSGLADGQHTIVASMTDLAGNTGSSSLTFMLNGTPTPTAPVVTNKLVSDTGASASDKITANSSLTGTADPNAVVHFTVDGSPIAATATADASGAWSFAPTGLADGTHTIVASETNAGGTGSASLTFTLETQGPVPVITGGTLANGQATLTGTSDNVGDTISIYDGYSWQGFATSDGNRNWSFTTSAAANVVHTYGANSTDLAGNEGHGASNYVLDGSTPTPSVPVVTEKLVSDTGASASDKITSNAALSGTADSNAVVHFTVDGTAVAATATANASGAWSFTPTGLADGQHTIVASETNAAGKTGTASLTFTLDKTAPSVTEKLVSGGTTTTSPALTGTADPNAVVHFTVDGNAIAGTATANSSGVWSYTPTGLADGQHTVLASVTDTAGNTGTSSLSFMLSGTPTPTPTDPGITLPMVTEKLVNDTGASSVDKITSDPALTGTADPNAVVHFTVDGAASAATATANASGVWSFTPTGLADGTHTLVASETTAAGNTGAAALTFTLDAHVPIPSITGVVASNGQATLTGTTGEASDTISLYDGNTWLCFTPTDSQGTWNFTAKAPSNVVHTYGANATDLGGHEGHGSGQLILGSLGADNLVGSAGNDVIVGNGGNDQIAGGVGADKLTGGSGNVTFAYNSVNDSTFSASDTITDFIHGTDKIDFTNIAGINATNGVPQFQGNIAGSGSVTLNAHSVAYMEVGGNTVVLVNTTGTAEAVTSTDTHAADMKIDLVGVNLGLTSTDFHHA